MPSQVRIISGPRNRAFDSYIEDLIERDQWEIEHFYFGIEELDRAVHVRNKLVTAGRHMNPPVAVKAFRVECGGCQNGGPGCRYHVSFTIYDMDKARAYKDRMSKAAGSR